MLNSLLHILDNDFDSASGGIRITSASYQADVLLLQLEIQLHEELPPQQWQISCEDVIEESICFNHSDTLSLNNSSPLLLPYTEPEVELMFTDNTMPAASLLGLVCSACTEVMGHPRFISRFINQRPTVTGIVGSCYGQLGRFPYSLAQKIINLTAPYPVRINAMPGREPKRWNGTEFLSYPPLTVLQTESSYIIANYFSARLLSI